MTTVSFVTKTTSLGLNSSLEATGVKFEKCVSNPGLYFYTSLAGHEGYLEPSLGEVSHEYLQIKGMQPEHIETGMNSYV